MSGYVDVIVMRHPEPGAVNVSVIKFIIIIIKYALYTIFYLDRCKAQP